MAGVFARRLIDPANSEHLAAMKPLAPTTNRGVIHCHGNGGTHLEAYDASPEYNWGVVPRAIAQSGCCVIAGDLGGTTTAGNDLSIARVGQARNYLQSTLGAPAGKVFVCGTSGGFLTACNWARQNKSSVAGILGFVFANDLPFLYSDPANQPGINAAYGGAAAYEAGLPTHNPNQYGPTDLAGVPMLLCYALGEGGGTVTQQNFVAAMQAASPGKVTVATQAGGHSLVNLDTSVIRPFLDTWA